MKILAINAGSSTLKFQLFEMPMGKSLAKGMFKENKKNYLYSLNINAKKIEKPLSISHNEVIQFLINELIENNLIEDLNDIKAIGHRVVHGGEKYFNATIINQQVLLDIEKYSDLAPLHNPKNLEIIKKFQITAKDIINVAVFDTAFHQTIKASEFIFPTPYDWYQKYQIRQYGFHGISHQYLSEKSAEILGENKKIITCHLGNGSSITAINNGKSVNTSMGFTPNSGLIMGTRSGDLDFTIVPYLAKTTKKDFSEIFEILNNQSGFLGLTGSSDFQELEKAYQKGNPKAILAYQKLLNSIVDYLAKYIVFLNGIDALIFSGGIGENAVQLRNDVIKKLKIFGFEIEKQANNNNKTIISSSKSTCQILVIPTNEELMIAKSTYQLIK